MAVRLKDVRLWSWASLERQIEAGHRLSKEAIQKALSNGDKEVPLVVQKYIADLLDGSGIRRGSEPLDEDSRFEAADRCVLQVDFLTEMNRLKGNKSAQKTAFEEIAKSERLSAEAVRQRYRRAKRHLKFAGPPQYGDNE